ncbi:MAG: hypothetical protein O7C75_19450 [Verrucomicrobia bacterium]|nr:hypothetical protein [Verrucomicrobiota bacterium]
MIFQRILIFVWLATLSLTACAKKPVSQIDLFAAMIMTKAQVSSSIPTDSGVLVRNSDTGDWQRIGPKIQMISSATADPSDTDTIFLACGNGIVRTTNGGVSWHMVTGWRESDVLQIAIDPSNGDRVYAATAWGVTRSTDGGESWVASNTGLPEYFSKGIVLDQRQPNRLLLATTTGLFESKNHAKSWQRLPSFPEVAALRLRRSESHPDFWIAGTEGKGVWISRDDGQSWKSSTSALKDANVYAVAIDPFDSSSLAAGGWSTGVYLSDNGGKSWMKAKGELPSPNITSMVFDANVPHRVWVSTFEEGTFYSDNAGSTWINADLDGAYVFDLGFLPTQSKQ